MLPRLVEKSAGEADGVILVDHNERQQSAEDIDQVRVLKLSTITVSLTLKQAIHYINVQNQLAVRQPS